MNTESFIQSFQASIAPCILISGLGLLLLSMTNRLGRTIDRLRIFTSGMKSVPESEILLMRRQITILYRRGRLLQTAIGLISVSIFSVSVIMLMLFSTLAFNIMMIAFIKLFFVASLICLMASLVFFLLDVRLSLSSVRLEIEHMEIT